MMSVWLEEAAEGAVEDPVLNSLKQGFSSLALLRSPSDYPFFT